MPITSPEIYKKYVVYYLFDYNSFFNPQILKKKMLRTNQKKSRNILRSSQDLRYKQKTYR